MSGEGVLPNRRSPVTKRMRRSTIVCPVCNGDAMIRDSHQETELVKWFWCMCQNPDCGLTWKAQLAFIHSLSPSAIERPDLALPGPPPGYVRRVYPAGPPGVPPDPNQFVMFGELDDADRPQAA